MNKSKVKYFTGLLELTLLLFSIGCVTASVTTDFDYWSREMGPPGGGSFSAVANGDFNNDGIQDLAGGNSSGNGIQIWYGHGGDIWEKGNSIEIIGNITSLAAADFNNDGMVDIAASVNSGNSGVFVWYSLKYNEWEGPVSIETADGFSRISAVDINNDGKKDIIAANISETERGGVYAWLNLQDRWSSNIGPVTGTSYSAVRAADFNYDHITDIAAAVFNHRGRIDIWLGNGSGGWSSIRSPEGEGLYNGLEVGDFNSDGMTDMAASMINGGIFIWLGRKNLGWSSPIVENEGETFISLAAGDFTGDGEIDLAASSAKYQGIAILEHGSGANFNNSDAPIGARQRYLDIKAADIDGNRKIDIVAANAGQGIHVWYQGGVTLKPDSTSFLLQTRTAKEELTETEENLVFKKYKNLKEYKIGIGDVIQIRIWTGLEKKEFTAKVQSDGTIFIPFFGITEIKVENLCPTEFKDILTSTLKEYLKYPVVEVEVLEYTSKYAYLLGEVRVLQRSDTGPGRYPLKGMTTILDFITTHGGTTDKADLQNVQLIKSDGTRRVINLYRMIFESGINTYPPLDNTDTLFVSSKEILQNRVFVLGEVGRPGVIEFNNQITLLEAISKAGGVTKDAVTSKIFIARGDLNAPEVIEVNLDEILQEGKISNNIVLENGDALYISRKFLSGLKEFMEAIMPLVRLVESFYIISNL